MHNIVFGFLGTQLDGGFTDKRWERWRPTVALCAHPQELEVHRLELFLTKAEHEKLAQVVVADIARVSPGTEVRMHLLDLDDPWDFARVYATLHDFATRYDFRDDASYFVHLTTGSHIAQICAFLLTEARYFPAKLLETAMYRGLRRLDMGKTPSDEDLQALQEAIWRGSLEIIDLDLSTYDQLSARFARERETAQEVLKGGIATRNTAFNTLVQRIEQVSLRSKAPMLFVGETGVGKSAMAERVYALRKQRHLVEGPLVVVNCATLRGDNAMSALFGHKKGAFTGAAADRAGLLKSADGGMLFLDEIAELGPDEQAMLLRCLEDGTFLPLGSDKAVSSRFQLLAGTNEDLRSAVRRGTFRADLFARINLWTFELPGLRQRSEDIEPNLDHELGKAEAGLKLHVSMNKDAREAYVRFARKAPWPGNFRDFSASVLRMATLAEGGRITQRDVEQEIEHLAWVWGGEEVKADQDASWVARAKAQGLLTAELDPFDEAALECALRTLQSAGSMAEAGRQLFAVSRAAKGSANDTDRLRKYLTRVGVADVRELLEWLRSS